MKKLIKLSAVLLTISTLSGCVFIQSSDGSDENWQQKQQQNREMINQLSLDTDKNQIELKLGVPNFTEAFIKSGQEYRVMYYRTSRQHHDSATSKDETTPLIFKNNKLIGWGFDALANIQ